MGKHEERGYQCITDALKSQGPEHCLHGLQARKAAGLTRETDERNKRLQVAFSIVSITTFILGAAILVFPEKVCSLRLPHVIHAALLVHAGIAIPLGLVINDG